MENGNIEFFDAIISEPGKDLKCECRFITGKNKNAIIIFQESSNLQGVDNFIIRLQIFLDKKFPHNDNFVGGMRKTIKNIFNTDSNEKIINVSYKGRLAEVFFGYKPDKSIFGTESYTQVYSENGEEKFTFFSSKKELAEYIGCDEKLIDLPREGD
ncbi:hypothetical protein [uncultured Desulfovibrio sp.]|uniref:hypothetical protein n=1 Tax=uncultured Desulfovibrio sp. TaxID=167968 RepID=UPI002804DA35|nr:hypothetical protein [uncultured Desulfovibrio sp.]